MPNAAFAQFVQVVFSVIFLGSIVAGLLFWKNHDRWLGRDLNMPSENTSARAYSKMMIFIVWAHVFILSGAFALMLH